jgi:hypothetical protein
MRPRLVLVGWFAVAGWGLAAAQGPDGRSEADRPDSPGRLSLRLETDLETGDGLAHTFALPAQRDADFYRRRLGDVFGVLRSLAEGSVPRRGGPAPGLEQLRLDAARLTRVRLRQTAEDRKASGETFDAFRDMLRKPEFYAGRPFTVWGHLRQLKRLDPGEGDSGGYYEASIESVSDGTRPVLAVIRSAPTGISPGDDLRVPVTATGYLFRAESAAPSANGRGFIPLLAAWTLQWHRAELSEAQRQSLTSAVQHRRPHRPEEVDDFYGLLRHAQLVADADLKAAAQRFRQTRIQQFPADSRADLNHRLRQLDDRRPAHSPDEAERERAVKRAHSIYAYQQQQYRVFRNAPERFPTFAHLFRSVESSEPHRYTGRPVTLAGYIRKHVSYPADPENEYGVGWLHEVWLYPEDGDSNPVVVVSTSVPEGLPAGEKLLERAAVTGYFYKMWAYPARDTMRVAPMILARRVEWFPAQEAAAPPRWLIVSLWTAGALLAIAIVWAAWRRGRRRGLPEKYLPGSDGESPDFSQFT